MANKPTSKQKISAGKYEYSDSNGKKWLLQNQGYYFAWQDNMWSAYGEVPLTKWGNIGRWNAADLEISNTMTELIKKIERRHCE